MQNALFFVAFIFLFSSCGPAAFQKYRTAAYDDLANEHEILAILPVEVITTGRIPEEITEEDLQKIEAEESKAFQASLYTQLAKESGSRNRDIQVNFQHYAETNARLEEANISYDQAINMAPGKLAQILKVDAVVKTRIEKEQYLTDLESLGIQLVRRIAVLTNNYPYPGFLNSKTSDVFVNMSALDAEHGIPVWALDQVCPTYWNKSTREIIDDITRWMANRFPYRN